MGRRVLAAALAVIGLAAGLNEATAAVSYTTAGSLYSQDFGGLPTDLVQNGNIQVGNYTSGWVDDTDWATSPAKDVGVTGWYLFHPLDPGAPEDGSNGHQRLRVGPGANTGGFWLFGSANSDPDKALGSVGSTTVASNGANMFMGLQLVNNTGTTLHSFTLTYNGEQWRDGQSASPETLAFDYSTVSTGGLWTVPGTAFFTPVSSLNFTSPVFSGTGTSGTAVDGNAAGRVNDITAAVSGLNWEPGGELWLRWADPQLASAADDGLAIDNVRFTASTAGTGSAEIVSVQSGASSSGSTWSNSQPPTVGNKYRIVTGHTVTLDSAFAGDYLRVGPGATLNVGPGGNAVDIRALFLDAGASLTKSVSGDFQLGDVSAAADPGILALSENVTLNADANSDVRIDLSLYGSKDLTVNSNGAGSDLLIANAANHTGVIHFNGTGEHVILFQSQAFNRIEMNSTGTNALQFLQNNSAGGGTMVFNQPGRVEHFSQATGARLVQQGTLIANAPVTVDLTQTYTPASGGGDERRFNLTNTSALEGSGNITVVGTPSDPTDTSLGISLNEFEVGSTAEPSSIQADAYSGTLTGQDYLNIEIRHSLAAAKVVVNNHARVETGHQVVGTAKIISLGDVQVNAGGAFEVGFEQVQNGTGNNGTGNHVGHLNLVNTSGRTGTLTLTNGGIADPNNANSTPIGSELIMQVNGKNTNEFDTITANSVHLDGVLKILVNPPSSILGAPTATPPVPATRNPIYNPQLGDVIPLITASGVSPTADFDHNSVVNAADLTVLKTSFGASAGGDADGDGDTDGNDFLLWQRQLGQTGSGGVTGTFDSVVFLDIDNTLLVPADPHPDTSTPILVDAHGVMASLGLKFQIQYTATAVNLLVVSASAVAVPEPAAASMILVGLVTLAARRRSQRSA